MDYRPLLAYFIIFILYRISEIFITIRVGSFKRRPKCEWTMPLIHWLFVLATVVPVLEYIYLRSGPGYISYLCGGSLFILGTFFRVKGHLDLKKGFSPAVELIEDQRLVDTGLYRYIRHPLYIGSICLFFACPLFLGSRFSLVLSFMGLFAIFLRIRKEEKFLVKNMEGYEEYMNRTWALIPKVY
ncbi:methyltransferase family protein [Gemmatimonadota bacterium]